MKEQIALELFGTSDFDGVLDVLAPSDTLVKEFHKRVKEINEDKGDDGACQTQKTKSHKR